MHTHAHTYAHTHANTCAHSRAHTHGRIHAHMRRRSRSTQGVAPLSVTLLPCVCVHVRVRVCVFMCVCVCLCVCVRARMWVHAHGVSFLIISRSLDLSLSFSPPLPPSLSIYSLSHSLTHSLTLRTSCVYHRACAISFAVPAHGAHPFGRAYMFLGCAAASFKPWLCTQRSSIRPLTHSSRMDKGKGWHIFSILIWIFLGVWVVYLSNPKVGVFTGPLALEFAARVARIYGLKFML